MSDPWIRSSPANWPQGPNAGTDNFSGLANGSALCLGVINPGTVTSPYGDIILPTWKVTFASAPTTGTYFYRYALFSEDNTNWPGNISPTSTSSQATALTTWQTYDPSGANAALIDQLTLQSGTTTYYTRWISLRGLYGGGNIPTYTTILIYNTSGVALATYSAGNQLAEYVVDTYA